jgi:2-iminobutanoate/2-iminopropanoate deaminase
MAEPVFTDQAPRPGGFYSQAVRAGQMVFVSGQLPMDLNGKLKGETAGEQARQAIQNVAAILTAAGGSLASLVQVTIYVSDIAHWPEVNTVYREMLKNVPVPPARAVVPVKEMHFGAQVEIQAIAMLPAGAMSPEKPA